MSAKLLSVPERVGKTFGIAIRVLGALAVIQLVLILWALLMRFDGERRSLVFGSTPISIADAPGPPRPPIANPSAGSGTGAGTGGTVSPGVIDPGGTAAIPNPPDPAPLVGNPLPNPPIENFNPMPLPPVAPQRDASRFRIQNRAAQTSFDKGLELRESGDTQGALDALKKADSSEADQPKILYELATTYEQMALEKKATDVWVRLVDMGWQKAGPYWELANMALSGKDEEESGDVETTLMIAGQAVVPVDTAEGEHKKLVLKLKSTTDDSIRADQMFLQVFFLRSGRWLALRPDDREHDPERERDPALRLG